MVVFESRPVRQGTLGVLEPEHDDRVCAPHGLQAVADKGESGATPLIELAVVASRVIPFVILMIGLIVGVYFLTLR